MRIFPMAILAIAALFSNAKPAVARDCIGSDGGLAICMSQQWTEWRYGVELDAGSAVADKRAECIGAGGEFDEVTYGCIGSAFPVEETVVPMAVAKAQRYYNCGVTGISSDTGWGHFGAITGHGELCSDDGNSQSQCRRITIGVNSG